MRSEKYLQTSDGVSLRHSFFCSECRDAELATLCIIHGFSEHAGRYEYIASHLAADGKVAVHLVDLRGHGLSSGLRNSCAICTYTLDIAALLLEVDEEKPCFVYCHSMGGLVTLKLIAESPHLPLAGVIFSAPLLRLHPLRQPSWHKRLLARIMGVLLPEMYLMADVDPFTLTHDTTIAQNLLTDHLSLPMMSTRLAASMLDEPYNIHPSASKRFALPLLVLHGDNDVVTDCDASQQFYNLAESKDKSFRVVRGGRHEMHSDSRFRDGLCDIIKKWIMDRAATSQRAKGLKSSVHLFLAKSPLHATRILTPCITRTYRPSVCVPLLVLLLLAWWRYRWTR